MEKVWRWIKAIYRFFSWGISFTIIILVASVLLTGDLPLTAKNLSSLSRLPGGKYAVVIIIATSILVKKYRFNSTDQPNTSNIDVCKLSVFEIKHNAIIHHEKIGDLLLERRDGIGAESHYKSALKLRRELLNRDLRNDECNKVDDN